MKTEVRKEFIEKTIYIAQDGKIFDSEKECKSWESWLRGKETVKTCTLEDELRYFFKVEDKNTWTDCLTFLGSHLYTRFLEWEDFEEFNGKWVFTEYDVSSEFYRLRDADYMKAVLASEISELSNQLEFLNTCV